MCKICGEICSLGLPSVFYAIFLFVISFFLLRGCDFSSDFPVPNYCLYFTLQERLRTHKVLTKDQCFYLNYHKFSIKSYVLDVY